MSNSTESAFTLDYVDNALTRAGRRVVKYCDVDTQRSILSGNLWLRSHAKYQEGGNDFGDLMSDREEGQVNHRIQQMRGESARIGDIQLSGNRFYEVEPGAFPIEIRASANAFLFCASLGIYEVGHHRIMRDGNSEYKGTPKNSCYVEFDTLSLVNMISDNIQKMWGEHEIGLANCIYNDRQSDIYRLGPLSELEAFSMEVFSKPTRLTVENEVRIAVVLDERIMLEVGDTLKLEIQNISSAITGSDKLN